jgi:adenine-specific DNA-methyltransferase
MTNENDIVFDPYAGVASSLIAAVKNGRRALGVDSSDEYVRIGHERLLQLIEGRLETRPLGKPVYESNGNGGLTQIPMEWLQLEGSVYK